MSELNIEELLRMAGIQAPSHSTANQDGTQSPFSTTDAGMSENLIVVFNDSNAAQRFSSLCQANKNSMGCDVQVSEDGMRFKVPAKNQAELDSMMEGFDLDNGYYTVQQHDELAGHGKDYFPSAQTGTSPKKLGPSAAKHGNNPLSSKQFSEGAQEIHETLVYRYREYKKTK